MKKGQAMVEYLIVVSSLIGAFAIGARIFREALVSFFHSVASLMALPIP